MNKQTVVIYHNADYDGIFCREIARKFLPDAYFVGWNYGDPFPLINKDSQLYMLDISVDGLMDFPNLIWVDHHKSAIERYLPLFDSPDRAAYVVDGVAACRLAWQFFASGQHFTSSLPTLDLFKTRKVNEPYAVTLAGEYDIWDHKPSEEEDISFQFGLDAVEELNWSLLLSTSTEGAGYANGIVGQGKAAQRCIAKRDADVIQKRSFLFDFEGLKFLALNTARCNSISFAAMDTLENGHDALMGFYWDGTKFNISLYHAKHHTDIDLSTIAVKYGGGGHRGACGFNTKEFLFIK